MNQPHEGRCASCEFAHRIPAGLRCLRNPPTVHLVPITESLAGISPQLGVQGIWPPVDPDNWCGEYAPRTEKQPPLDADTTAKAPIHTGAANDE